MGKLITTLKLHKSFDIPACQQPTPLIFSSLALILDNISAAYIYTEDVAVHDSQASNYLQDVRCRLSAESHYESEVHITM